MTIQDITVVDQQLICALLAREVANLQIKRCAFGSSQDIDYALANLGRAFQKMDAAKP